MQQVIKSLEGAVWYSGEAVSDNKAAGRREDEKIHSSKVRKGLRVDSQRNEDVHRGEFQLKALTDKQHQVERTAYQVAQSTNKIEWVVDRGTQQQDRRDKDIPAEDCQVIQGTH